MAETLTSLSNAVLHAIGRTPASTTSSTAIVNDALAYFCNAHDWRWRDTDLALNVTISQNYVALPTNFEQLNSLRSGTSAIRTILPCTLDEIMTLRQLSTGVGGYYYYCVSWTAQASVTAAPIAKLEIYPTPAASEVGTFAGKYRRKIADLSAGTDAPDMPAWAQPALKQMVRAWAVFVEDQQQGTDWELAQTMLDQAKKIDGTAETLLGLPRYRVGTYSNDQENQLDRIRLTPWNYIGA